MGIENLEKAKQEPLARALAELSEAKKEIKKLREENQRLGGASTMMGCDRCGNGVRPRYAVHGLCAECARTRITELKDSLAAKKGNTDA